MSGDLVIQRVDPVLKAHLDSK
ncbi:hypothetical protein KIPB_012065, partial [Kipferlia bialata]|eukprot:g12065.t1